MAAAAPQVRRHSMLLEGIPPLGAVLSQIWLSSSARHAAGCSSNTGKHLDASVIRPAGAGLPSPAIPALHGTCDTRTCCKLHVCTLTKEANDARRALVNIPLLSRQALLSRCCGRLTACGGLPRSGAVGGRAALRVRHQPGGPGAPAAHVRPGREVRAAGRAQPALPGAQARRALPGARWALLGAQSCARCLDARAVLATDCAACGSHDTDMQDALPGARIAVR